MVWAEDVAAVVEVAGSPPVLVGASYGGLVIIDYLRVRGGAELAGIVLVGAPTEIGPGHPGGTVGAAMAKTMRAALSEDPAVAVPALTELTGAMTAAPAPGELVQRWLGDALRVPPRVRAALFRRDVDSADVLAAVALPALVLHGTADVVVDPSAAVYAAGKIPSSSLRWFYDVGHLPFVERVEEFNRTLREFASRCHAQAG
jgi:pimeloyl-ACP methyl ester carboxylesterase